MLLGLYPILSSSPIILLDQVLVSLIIGYIMGNRFWSIWHVNLASHHEVKQEEWLEEIWQVMTHAWCVAQFNAKWASLVSGKDALNWQHT
jgi:hypothetical protein